LMAAGLLGFGAVAWVAAHPRTVEADSAKPVVASVLVLARDLRAGTLLKAEDVTSKEMPQAGLRPDTILGDATARRDLLGGMIKRSLSNGDPLREGDVMRPGEHGFLAAVLSPGMRAVAVAVDSVTGTAGLIWPGDRVDLILTQTLEDAQLPPGRRIAGETVLRNARVIAIDQLLVQGGQPDSPEPKAPRTVTLEVAGAEAERVQVATRIGRLSLAVRAAQSAQEPASTGGPAKGAEPVWAGDVSNALRGEPVSAPPRATVLRVFNGSAEGKEFKY
ncbi:MAG TPA: Flp pilus assembly protein CpaB, partial [Acetobacteraceae bacterium]|nr:Flp pilus assembly protein CpaB [Acetobacteraceae bacterium]